MSRQDFYDHVWPFISDWYLGGRLIKQSEDCTAKILDSEAGIDEQIRMSSGIIPVAVRVQYVRTDKGRSPFNTFTLRKSTQGGCDTELHKMLNRLSNDCLGARDMIHAYLDKNTKSLLSCAAAPWQNVLAAVYENLHQQNFNREDGNWFAYAYFEQVEVHGLIGMTPQIELFKQKITKQLNLPLKFKNNAEHCAYITDRFLSRYGVSACP